MRLRPPGSTPYGPTRALHDALPIWPVPALRSRWAPSDRDVRTKHIGDRPRGRRRNASARDRASFASRVACPWCPPFELLVWCSLVSVHSGRGPVLRRIREDKHEVVRCVGPEVDRRPPTRLEQQSSLIRTILDRKSCVQRKKE